MESEIHQVLGDIKIWEICDCYGLDGNAKNIIDGILLKPERKGITKVLTDIDKLFTTTKNGYSVFP